MYFITCFSKCEKDERGWLNLGATRTFGYEETLEDADYVLNNNVCDLYEYLYIYAIVEKLGRGPHPDCEERYFYKWDDEKKGFFRAEEPEILSNFRNIALG